MTNHVHASYCQAPAHCRCRLLQSAFCTAVAWQPVLVPLRLTAVVGRARTDDCSVLDFALPSELDTLRPASWLGSVSVMTAEKSVF